jgi:flagellar basal-body rod modification protein FlgD
MANDINNVGNSFLDQMKIKNKQAENAEKSKDGLAQTDFLKLLMTQVQNQDPMKPQDNGEFLGQMAQFSTVSGLQDMQKSIDNLSNSFVSNQALQASSLVGRLVLVPSEHGNLPPGEGDRFFGSVEPTQTLKDVSLEITSSSGELIKTMPMGTLTPGMERFSWDGKNNAGEDVSAGEYKISAVGTDDEGNKVGVETHVLAPVDSVTLGRGGEKMQLNVAGFGSMGIDKIREIM